MVVQFQSLSKLIHIHSKLTPVELLQVQLAVPTLTTQSLQLDMVITTISLRTHGELGGVTKATSSLVLDQEQVFVVLTNMLLTPSFEQFSLLYIS